MLLAMPDPLPDPSLDRRVARLLRKVEQLEAMTRQFQREHISPSLRVPSIRVFNFSKRESIAWSSTTPALDSGRWLTENPCGYRKWQTGGSV